RHPRRPEEPAHHSREGHGGPAPGRRRDAAQGHSRPRVPHGRLERRRRRGHDRGVRVIADETVERVRESADIVGVIGEYVELKRQGSDYRGPCPFHQGTHRNFSVSPKKQMYYCFVCHEGGDVFNFLTKRLGVDWPTAVRMVAEKSGIEVVETQSRRSAEEKD